MKRPLVAVVSIYSAGLLLAEFVQPPLVALFAIAFIVLLAALILERFRPWLCWPLLVLAGWTNLASRTAVVSPHDLRTLVGTNDALVTVRGTLATTPHLRLSERDDQPVERSLAQVRVAALRQDSGWRPAVGDLVVTTPGTLPTNFFAGQPVEISGVIGRPPLLVAEGLFDYREFLQTRGIFYLLKTGSVNDWQPGVPALPRPPLTDRFLSWSQRTLALGLPVEDQPLRLLWAMTLGWRTALTPDISEPFLRAGTMHLFAIDGLRIALISGMLVALLRVLQVSRAWCGIAAIPLIWFYTAATGWESPAVRASVMMTVVLGGWALKRPGDTINSLAAAALIILLWEPRQLFEASFQLSFFVVLVIVLMLPPLNRMADRLWAGDPLLPDELRPRWRRALLATLRTFSRYAALSFAAWIGSIPLAAKYFHLFSPVSTPANIVAVPLGTLALMSNLGALVCGTWFPWATGLFNHSAWFFMSAMTAVSEWAARIPGAFFYVPAPSWPAIAIYYAVLIGGLSGWLFAPRRRIWSAAALLLVATGCVWLWQATRDEVKLTVLPLPGGHAVFADAAGRSRDWLVDCGNENAADDTLKPFLRAQGVNRIQRLALTHGDMRNCGGAERLDELFGIGEIYTSPVRFRSAAYRKIVSEFEKPPARHRILHCGGTAGDWQVLHPAATDDFDQADDNALVLLGNFNGARVLLLSDLGRKGQSALLARTNDLGADVVFAGLTDDGEPLCDALLDAVQPKIIVVADSEFPATHRADRKLKERLGRRTVPVIYTRTAGAVTLTARTGGWELRTMAGQKFSSRTGAGNGTGNGTGSRPPLPPE
ncbi:MAG: ComEC/Rec2 family competence protein [Limisphaerales bacterium]